jgi:uncharacterized protein (TIGR03905 family)
MQTYSFQTQGICPTSIAFSLENGKIYHIVFTGGCPGNTAAIAKLLEGTDAARVVKLLKGNDCGGKGTSCADQLAVAVEQALLHEASKAKQVAADAAGANK